MKQQEKQEIAKVINAHLKRKGFTKEDFAEIEKQFCKMPPRKLNLIVKS